MGQGSKPYDFESDFQPYQPYDFESDFQPYETGYGTGGDFTTSYGDLGTHFFGPQTYPKPGYRPEAKPDFSYFNPGGRMPGEQPDVPFEGPAGGTIPEAFRSWWKIPEQMFNTADAAAKRAAANVQKGEYGAAFGDITSPITDMLKPGIEGIRRYYNEPAPTYEMKQGPQFSPGERMPGEMPSSPIAKVTRDQSPASLAAREQSKQQVIHDVVSMTGAPVEEVLKAWEDGDYGALAAHATMATLTAGLAHAVGKAITKNPPPAPSPPGAFHGPEPPPGFFPRKSEWIESLKETPPVMEGPEIGPYGVRDPRFGQQAFDFEAHPDLLAGLAYRAPSGRMTKTGPALPPKMRGPEPVVPPSSIPTEHPWLEFYPEQGDLLKDLYKQPTPAPVDAGPMWPAPRTEAPSTPPTIAAAPVSTAPPSASPVSTTPPAVTRGQVLSDLAPKGPKAGIRLNKDGSLTVPATVPESFFEGRAEAGYTVRTENPDGTITLRKPGGTSAGMFFDPRALELIKEQLRRMFGREPTPVEIETVAERQMGEGEQSRGVANFEPRGLRESLRTEDLQRYLTDENIPPELKKEIENLLRTRGVIPSPDYSPIPKDLYSGWNWDQPASEVPREGAMTIPSEPQLQVPPEASGLDVGGIRQQNLLPDPMRLATERVDEGPFAATIDSSGNWSVVDSEANRVGVFNNRAEAELAARQMNMTEAISGIDTPRPPSGELPFGPMRENVPTETPGLAEAEVSRPNVDQMFRGVEEPREQQQSMMADFIDNEIDQHFQEQGIESRPTSADPNAPYSEGGAPRTPADHVIDIADRIINQRGGPSTGGRTPEGDMRAGTTADTIMDMVHDARDKWHENDVTETGERTAPSRIQQHQNDRVEIDTTTDVARARRIREYWGERYQEVSEGRPTPERTHAVTMYARASARVMEINEGRPATPPPIPEAARVPAPDLTPEQRVAAVTDPNAPLANRRRIAEEEIRASETVEEAVAVRDHWLDQARDAGHSPEANFANEMARQARERVSELLTAEHTGTPISEVQRQWQRDRDEIAAAQTVREAHEIGDQWTQNLEDAIDTNDYAAETHAREMRRLTSTRADEILDARRTQLNQGRAAGTIPTPPSSATPGDRAIALQEARAKAGPNPPITPGLQPPKKRGINLTPEQMEKLRLSADETQVQRELAALRKRKADRAAGIKEKKEYTPGELWWRNVWGPEQLAKIPQTGDPGLSIIDTNPNTPAGYTKYYRVEYRDTTGKPVAMAKVTEEGSSGARRVPTMAADASNGAYGVASESVFKALIDMNAADAGQGTISNWTAKLIARMLLKMEGTNAGMFDLSQGIKPILKMVQNLLENKDAYNTKTRDGFANLMDTLNGVKNTKWWMDKAAEKYGWGKGSGTSSEGMMAPRIRTETGAVDVGTGINKVTGAVAKGARAVKESFGWGQGEQGKRPADEISRLAEAWRVPGGATTMLDMSGPGRQGLALVATPEFWGGVVRMFPALHYGTFKKMNEALATTDLMRVDVDPVTGKDMPSFGSQIGTKLFNPASEPGPRAESTASRWLEMGIGKNVRNPTTSKKEWQPTVGSKLWQHSVGYPIRAFSRSHVMFLNYLNVHRTTKLLDLARDMSLKGMETGRMPLEGVLGGINLPSEVRIPFSQNRISTGIRPGSNIGFTKRVTPEQAANVNPYHNIPRAKEIADFVNTATGHGPLKTHVLPHRSAEVSLESAADKLGYAFFSPGLIASRMRMMNPFTYVMATPFVRKQYLKAALSSTAAWFIMAQMIKNAAGDEAEVSYNPLSADFGKVRIGDARLDIGGGFAQFAVAASRAWVGGYESSSSGEYHRFGTGFQAETQKDKAENFFTNKLNPAAKFAYDIASASEYKPFHVGDRTMQLFIPLVYQDFYEISKEHPDLFPMFGPAAFFGGGTQIYSKGESVGKFIDPEEDWNVTGGGLRDVMPWNLGVNPGEESNLPRVFPWSEPIP